MGLAGLVGFGGGCQEQVGASKGGPVHAAGALYWVATAAAATAYTQTQPWDPPTFQPPMEARPVPASAPTAAVAAALAATWGDAVQELWTPTQPPRLPALAPTWPRAAADVAAWLEAAWAAALTWAVAARGWIPADVTAAPTPHTGTGWGWELPTGSGSGRAAVALPAFGTGGQRVLPRWHAASVLPVAQQLAGPDMTPPRSVPAGRWQFACCLHGTLRAVLAALTTLPPHPMDDGAGAAGVAAARDWAAALLEARALRAAAWTRQDQQDAEAAETALFRDLRAPLTAAGQRGRVEVAPLPLPSTRSADPPASAVLCAPAGEPLA